jgi:hypothetical protein
VAPGATGDSGTSEHADQSAADRRATAVEAQRTRTRGVRRRTWRTPDCEGSSLADPTPRQSRRRTVRLFSKLGRRRARPQRSSSRPSGPPSGHLERERHPVLDVGHSVRGVRHEADRHVRPGVRSTSMWATCPGRKPGTPPRPVTGAGLATSQHEVTHGALPWPDGRGPGGFVRDGLGGAEACRPRNRARRRY